MNFDSRALWEPNPIVPWREGARCHSASRPSLSACCGPVIMWGESRNRKQTGPGPLSSQASGGDVSVLEHLVSCDERHGRTEMGWVGTGRQRSPWQVG